MSGTGADNPNWRGGKASHPLYFIYHEMIGRCYRPTHRRFADYGGRGITVCKRWQGPSGFWHFVADMGPRPKGTTTSGKRPAYVLDRINNDRNYTPSNCRWADQSTSMVNRRIDPGHANRSKTHCKHGHKFTPSNTRINKKNGRRECRACAREDQAARRAARKGR